MRWLDSQLAAICERLAKTRSLNRKMVGYDIAAMKSELEDARAIRDLFTALHERAKKAKREPMRIQGLCKLLDDGWSYPQLRCPVQLLEAWDLYVERRRKADDSGRYGLAYALELIGAKPPQEEPAPLAIAAPTISHQREVVPATAGAEPEPAQPEPTPVNTPSQRRESSARPQPSASTDYVLTRPERWAELRAEWPDIVDLFPHPYDGSDAFALPRWPPRV